MPVKLNNEYYWLVPESLNIRELLLKYPPDFQFKVKLDHFYYIIDYIVTRMDWYDMNVTGQYVNIHSKELQSFNRNYTSYLEWLMSRPHQLIRSDNIAIQGKKSRGYCFTEEYNSIRLEQVEDHTIYMKVKKIVAQEEYSKKKSTKRYEHLTKWFNDKLTIDTEGALSEIMRLYPKETTGMRLARWRFKGEKSIAPRHVKRLKAIASVKKLELRRLEYSVDPNIGRFHSNLTNMKKELRKYIRYGDTRLTSVDIKSSQPWFAQLTMLSKFYERSDSHLTLFSFPSLMTISTTGEVNSKVVDALYTISLVESNENQYSKGFQRYMDLFKDNDFYHDLSKVLYPGRQYDKRAMKLEVMKLMYASNKGIGLPGNEGRRLFKAEFPAVHDLFSILKRGNHVFLSHILQRIESYLVVEVISRRIASERPDMPLFTVHDSIVCPEGQEVYVTEVMTEEIEKFTGRVPVFGIEDWF